MRTARGCGATCPLLRRTIGVYITVNPRIFRPSAGFRKVIAMSILRFLQSWRRYNASLRELSHLNDRELADIGISRSDIPRVALDSSD